jgi:amino-acid N-acetyltransferase
MNQDGLPPRHDQPMKTVAPHRITPASPGHAAAIAARLKSAGLPHDDFIIHLPHFLVASDEHGAVIGAIGAEVHGRDGLLRSLVVAPERRGTGLGGRLVAALDHRADAWGIAQWWLLTTTAQPFFAARGFAVTARSAAPERIAATAEFRGLCPAAAVCMQRVRKGTS